MIEDEKILTELQKINYNLEIQNSSFKRAGKAFSNGVFTALGYIFGTVIVTAIIIYILSQLPMTKSIMQTVSEFTQKYSPNVQLSVPSPDQP